MYLLFQGVVRDKACQKLGPPLQPHPDLFGISFALTTPLVPSRFRITSEFAND